MKICPRREHGRVEMRRKNFWVSTSLPKWTKVRGETNSTFS